jgi:hypothetical protein
MGTLKRDFFDEHNRGLRRPKGDNMGWQELAASESAREQLAGLVWRVWKLSLLLEQRQHLRLGSSSPETGRDCRIEFIHALRAQGLTWRQVGACVNLSPAHAAKLCQQPYPVEPTHPPPPHDLAREASGLAGWAAVLHDLLADHPEAWMGVPRDARVALPWARQKGSSRRAYRMTAGCESFAARISSSCGRFFVFVQATLRSGGSSLRPLAISFSTIEDAMMHADGMLSEADPPWVLLGEDK